MSQKTQIAELRWPNVGEKLVNWLNVGIGISMWDQRWADISCPTHFYFSCTHYWPNVGPLFCSQP